VFACENANAKEKRRRRAGKAAKKQGALIANK
jgi:hypothetical protein